MSRYIVVKKPKYFGDKMTMPMQEYVKEMVATLEKHNDWFKFNKPPHEISVCWDYVDWCRWIDDEWARNKKRDLHEAINRKD